MVGLPPLFACLPVVCCGLAEACGPLPLAPGVVVVCPRGGRHLAR